MKLLLLTALLIVCAPALSEATHVAASPASVEAKTPIQHLVVLLQENHTFDNYFGTFPGADGTPANTCMPVDPSAPQSPQSPQCITPFHIGSNDVALGDLDHSSATHAKQYNDGKMNGFVAALNERRQDGRLAMAYYDERDLPYYWYLARNYVLFDRFFSSASDGSPKNHMYAVAASTLSKRSAPTSTGILRPVIDNDAPTIFDRLEEKGISWKFYVQNYDPNLNYRTVDKYSGDRASQVIWVPLLNIDRFLDNPKFASHVVDSREYYKDLQNGTLPAVSYIAPSGASEHPPGSVASGERAVRDLINALSRSSAWSSSAFMLTYDDWGGWYDHVSPPQVDADGYGFRVPALLISPYSRVGAINHTTLDFTSILRFIEDNYGLAPLTQRDAAAASVASAFDFQAPPRTAYFWSDNATLTVLNKSSRRTLVYVTYGSGLALAGVVLFTLIALGARRTRRSTSYLQENEQQGGIP